MNNLLTMTSIRAMWHYIYIGLICQNCFAHSVLVWIKILFMKRCKTAYSKGKNGKAWGKGASKKFSNERRKWKRSFNFHLKDFVYLKQFTLFLLFIKFSFNSCVFILLCLYFVWQTEQYLVCHSEAGIQNCSVKPLFGKI